MAEVSASAPVKLCLSFTTGCSTPSFQTAIHPLLLCPSLLSHSLALRYGLWHQAGLYAITQRGDSEAPAVNAVAVLWCDKYISRHKCNVHACIHPECIYVRHRGRQSSHLSSLMVFFLKASGKAPGRSPPRPKLLRSFGPPELLLTGRLVAGQESANQG